MHQVDGAGRQALLVQDLDQAGGGPGGQVAGLDHGGAAGGEGEGKLLGDDQQREVPGGDDSNHADWFTDGERQIVLPEAVVRVPVAVLGERGGVVPDPGRAGYLILGLGDGLARLEGFDQGQLVPFGLDACGHPA